MNRGIASFITKFLNFQQAKVENHNPSGMTQNIDLPNWKWKMINMDFIIV